MKLLRAARNLLSSCYRYAAYGHYGGTAESIFGRDKLFDPSLVQIERGGIDPDPGTKAAGYLVRKYLSTSVSLLAIHHNIEPPNLFYYFGRDKYAFYDLSNSAAA